MALKCKILMLGALVLCTALQAHAQEVSTEDDDSLGVDATDGRGPPAWHASLSPYLWLSSFSGDVRPIRQAPQVSVHTSFREALDKVDAAAFVTGMARYGQWVGLLDFNYTSSSESGSISSLPGVDARGGSKQTTVLAVTGYRVLDDNRYSLDLMGGARWWQVKSRVSAEAGGHELFSIEDRFSWVDPVAAVRFRYSFTAKDQLLLYTDIGGFGVGATWSWQWLAVYNRSLGPRWMLSMGYRQLFTDYSKGGHVHDVRISGPLLGLSLRF
jgi:hypothetical protein